jgi:PadR family transcriptional regulator, regulatory protein PadR
MDPEIENKITQLRKGILELAIMGFLYRQAHYGYSLVKALTAVGDLSLKEGTIYPILQRMTREQLVHAEWVESSQGPPRKYYRLTRLGKTTYETLADEFRRLAMLVKDPSTASPSEKEEVGIGKKLSVRKEE